MLEYYEMIEKADVNKDYRTATVIEGAHAGEKILLENGAVLWTDSSFLPQVCDAVGMVKDTAVITVGEERIFVEIGGAEKHMVICGAGHVSIPIIRIAKMIGFHVTVIDDRQEFADRGRDAGADEAICGEFEQVLDTIAGSRHTYFVIVTRDHKFDSSCLRSILKKEYAYVGMMGSSRRVGFVKKALIADGYPEEAVNGVYTPIGLKINSDTPEEIAVSVLAEVIKVKNSHLDVIFPRPILDRILGHHHQEAMAGRKFLCTIVNKKGAAPRDVGSRMIGNEAGEYFGTVGGGLTEALVKQEAQKMLKENVRCRLLPYDLNASEDEEDGEVCGGEVEVFIEEI